MLETYSCLLTLDEGEEDEQTQYMVLSHLGHHVQAVYVVATGVTSSIICQTSPKPNNELKEKNEKKNVLIY